MLFGLATPHNMYSLVWQVWERYEPAAETATASGAEESANGHAAADSPRETLAVTVTEVVSGSEFYVQVLTFGWYCQCGHLREQEFCLSALS